MWDKLKIITLKGNEITPYIDELARMRVKVFHEYPYLYEGDSFYQSTYLEKYASSPECLVVMVLHDAKVIGMSAALPLEFETFEFQKPFLDAGKTIEDYFYFGGSSLLRAYRGQDVYPQYFEIREQAARQYGSKFATFCSIERMPLDMRKPRDYQPLDPYWIKRGYIKHPELVATLEWREVDEVIPSSKKMTYWIKKL